MNKFKAVIACASLSLSAGAMAIQPNDSGAHPVSDASAALSSPNADNTARNERDRTGRTLTPLDQSSDPQDVAVTTKIRKALTADRTLGTDAVNVKVITRSGQVTLRGPVANANEHAKVLDIAQGIALPTDVHDELEIKSH